MDKKIIQPSVGSVEIKRQTQLFLKPAGTRFKMERQRLMMDDFLRHQELKDVVVIDETK